MTGFLITLLVAATLETSDFNGKWTYQDLDEAVALELVHDTQTGRITGTLTMDGTTAPIEGHVRDAEVVMEKLNGISISLIGMSMVARRDGVKLVVSTTAPGERPEIISMVPKISPPVSRIPALPSPGAPAAQTPRAVQAQDFAGRWDVISDDGTNGELMELSVSGSLVIGELIAVERGYFSGRETVEGRYFIRGTFHKGTVDVQITDKNSPGKTLGATLSRRGNFLVVRMGQNERGFARPGQQVVESAEGSAEAAELERSIAGKVYATAVQAAGAGAFVGQRTRLALCADGRIALDKSDLASISGGFSSPDLDLGNTLSRRGSWTVVMLAGAPAVRAQWQGTGSSYALTAYFMIRPTDGGRAAFVDGVKLPVAGNC